MKSYSPFKQLAESLKALDRENVRNDLRIRRAAAKAKMGACYLQMQHWYQLMVSGQPEGDPVEMQGAEAKAQNEILAERYRSEINAAIDAGKPFGQTGAKLKKWIWLKDHDGKKTNP